MFARTLLIFMICNLSIHASDRDLLRRIDAEPLEITANNGDLRLYNLYILQARSILDEGDRGSVEKRMLADVYEPYKDFWHILYKNKATFRALTKHYVLKEEPPITEQITKIFDADVSTVFQEVAMGMIDHTGYRPKGKWYLIWATGQFDIGVPVPGVAILDWGLQKPTRKALEILFPHEFSHLIHNELGINDPDAGSVLDWCVTEGFAVYVAYAYWQGKYSKADCLQYQESEWQWALDKEDEIKQKTRTLLFSKSQKDTAPFKSGGAYLFEGGPSRMGYFIGFRMLQAYVAKKGEHSWREVYKLPVRQVIEESGYFD